MGEIGLIYNQLGRTGLTVSRMCFGSLVMGPLQVNLPVDKGAEVIRRAFDLGVNFIDTAELYGTYPYIREALKGISKDIIIASKTYAYTREGAAESLEKARKEMDRDVVDIFLLHEQESRLTLRGHRDALEYLLEAKSKGLVRAVGVSTHYIEVVDAAAEMQEIDVIHPIVNKNGLGIQDGSIDGMLAAIEKAYKADKGIYGMKPLGGGNLISGYRECMDFVKSVPFLHSIAIGMLSVEEVEANIAELEGRQVPDEVLQGLKREKRLHIDYWCEGCGRCAKKCGNDALKIVDGKVVVDYEKCLLCGYCSSVCPAFAIKIC